MAEVDRQLVQQIAAQVLAALRAQQGGGNGPAGEPAMDRAVVQPPAGVCTGDYSKFADLQRNVGAPAPAALNPHPAPDEEIVRPQAPAIGGIITADQLRDAMKAAPDGVATLAPDARLTPLAADLAREMPDKVRRLDASATRHASSAAQAAWLWWADGHCPNVHALTQGRRDLLASAAPRSKMGLLQVVRDLAQRVKQQRVAGGVLFVSNAALATCYVNRCRSLRGVLGTHEEAVDEGVRELGMNVLIIEYPRVKADRLAAMVERFLAQPPKAPPQAQRELRDLQECG